MTSSNPFFPSPWPVVHIARTQSGAPDPDTGVAQMVESAPVVRWVQCISQFGRERPSSEQVISEEFVQRVNTAIRLTVADPMTYSPNDKVLLFPTLDESDDYIPGTGIAFWVDGLPSDQSMAPWPQLFSVFGGIVALKRIT